MNARWRVRGEVQLEAASLSLVPFASGLLTTVVTLLLLRRYHSATAPAATLLFGSLSLWLFVECLALQMQALPDRILVGKLIYPGVVSVPVAVLLLAARASRRDRWITGRTLAALWLVPATTLVLVASNGLHGWIWPSIDVVETPSGPDLSWRHGPWFWVSVSYAYLLLGAASWLLGSKYLRDWYRYRFEAVLVFTGLAAPWLLNAVYLSGNSPLGNLDLTPYGFALTAVFLAWGLGREGILEATPVSRSQVVQELGDGLLVLDSRSRVVDLNAAAREILRAPEGQTGELWLHEALAGSPELFTILETRSTGVLEPIDIETARGPRTFDVRVSELHTEEERSVTGRLVVLRDVTDYLRANEAARAAAIAKSQFLANMSHEIRTPMNGVLGLAQHLSYLDLAEEPREVVADILRSGQALLQIIDDILDFSKLEAGKLRIDPVPFAPRQLVEDVAKLLAPRAGAQGISLETAVADDVPPGLMGDAGRLRQVLVNLASNAVKFTKLGGVAVRVDRESIDDGVARIRFAVEDSGIGIPAAALDAIFDAFTQADASTTRRFGGTGLGLAISRELVACMGGQLGVESEEGRGSRFWFSVPLPICAARQTESALPGPWIPTRSGARRPRVLAAEDNPVNQRVLLRFLERLGCEVVLAADGREAVDTLRSGGFDLVLMDCQMPVLDGFGATAEIRALPDEAARTPIVAVTAHAMDGDRERCLAHGMDDYLTKPIRLKELARLVARWVP